MRRILTIKGKRRFFGYFFLSNKKTAGKNQNKPIRRVTTGREPGSGSADGTGSYTIPRRPLPRKVHGLARFVTTRGGAYGFMPGLRALRWLADLRDAPP